MVTLTLRHLLGGWRSDVGILDLGILLEAMGVSTGI
jgi:hypothetical protein